MQLKNHFLSKKFLKKIFKSEEPQLLMTDNMDQWCTDLFNAKTYNGP